MGEREREMRFRREQKKNQFTAIFQEPEPKAIRGLNSIYSEYILYDLLVDLFSNRRAGNQK